MLDEAMMGMTLSSTHAGQSNRDRIGISSGSVAKISAAAHESVKSIKPLSAKSCSTTVLEWLFTGPIWLHLKEVGGEIRQHLDNI